VERVRPFGEAEFLTCEDPYLLVQWAQERTTDRKLRLLACACCRQVWQQLPDPRSRRAVEVAEQFADGLATPKELTKAYKAACGVGNIYLGTMSRHAFAAAQTAARNRLNIPAALRRFLHPHQWQSLEEARPFTSLVRDILGNPFRPPTLDPARLAWNDATIPRLALALYEERAFDRLPVLGDALEEAGCTIDDILSHCRSGAEHVRGCWVVDAVLAKS
jgi:hypothetical protein